MTSGSRRITVYLEDNLWDQFNHIMNVRGLFKNSVLGELCEEWVDRQLQENPELRLQPKEEIPKLTFPKVQL